MSFVDIDDIAEDGLLHSEEDRIQIGRKFKEAGVDGLFSPTAISGRSMRWQGWQGAECAGAALGAPG